MVVCPSMPSRLTLHVAVKEGFPGAMGFAVAPVAAVQRSVSASPQTFVSASPQLLTQDSQTPSHDDKSLSRELVCYFMLDKMMSMSSITGIEADMAPNTSHI